MNNFTSRHQAGIILDMGRPTSFDAMQRAVALNQRFLDRRPVQMMPGPAIQRMKRALPLAPSGGGQPPDKGGSESKKAKEEELPRDARRRMIRTVIGMIIANLNANQGPRFPSLASMASRNLANQLPDAMGPDKRSWQFASVGVFPPAQGYQTTQISSTAISVTGGMGTVTFASNDMRDMKSPTDNLSGMSKITDMQGTEQRKKIAKRVYHTETRQLAEGCRHIAVTGGQNCIFCSLYCLYNNVPYTYHTGAVTSWHLPENLSVTQFFGNAIHLYVQSAEFQSIFGPVANAQGLIDILCGETAYWW